MRANGLRRCVYGSDTRSERTFVVERRPSNSGCCSAKKVALPIARILDMDAMLYLLEARRLLDDAEREDRDLDLAEAERVGALLDAAEAVGRVARLCVSMEGKAA